MDPPISFEKKALRKDGEACPHMQRLLSRRYGTLLAFDFMYHTTERISTAHNLIFGRDLKYAKDDESRMICVKQCPCSILGKSTKQHRLRTKQGTKRIMKILPTPWVDKFRKYTSKYLKYLKDDGANLDIDPPLRDGGDVFYLFQWSDASTFRRLV